MLHIKSLSSRDLHFRQCYFTEMLLGRKKTTARIRGYVPDTSSFFFFLFLPSPAVYLVCTLPCLCLLTAMVTTALVSQHSRLPGSCQPVQQGSQAELRVSPPASRDAHPPGMQKCWLPPLPWHKVLHGPSLQISS